MTRLSETLGDLYSSLMARAAEEDRPQEFVIHLYQRMAERRIESRGRRNYARAADCLRHARAVHRHFNEEETWKTLIASIREQHRRLPAFQEELTNAGL